MSIYGLMKNVVTLQREATSSARDDAGAFTQSFSAVSGATAVRASVQPASGSVQRFYAQRSLNVSHTVYFAQDVGALPSDRLLDTVSGRTYVVVAYKESSPGRRVVWQADVEELRQSA